MTPAENKQLVKRIYSEVSNGNPKPLYEHMAEDISWTIIGSTPLSGTFTGVEQVSGKLFAGLRARLEGPVQFSFDRLVAEDDIVVLEAHGNATTKHGRPYQNRYCIVIRLAEGKLCEITDYVDTELVTDVLFS
jgi:ketosteroid isomerase-like protein